MINQHSMQRHSLYGALWGVALLLAACSSSAPADSAPTPPAAISTATALPAPAVTPTEEESAATSATSPVAADSQSEADPAADAKTVEFVIVPEETQAGYSIKEVFINDNNTLATAVGVTSQVQGGFTLNYDNPAASEFAQFVVDISTLKSDRSQRDRAIRRQWLESTTYPLAVFDVREVRNFPDNPQEGAPIAFQLAGDMTVKETTQPVVWDVTGTLEGDRLSGTATLGTTLESFNIPVPNIANILRVTDGITLTLDFVMQAAAE